MPRGKHSARVIGNIPGDLKDDADRIGGELDTLKSLIDFGKTPGGKAFVEALQDKAISAFDLVLAGDIQAVETMRVVVEELKQFYEADKMYEMKRDILDSFVQEGDTTLRSPKSYSSM